MKTPNHRIKEAVGKSVKKSDTAEKKILKMRNDSVERMQFCEKLEYLEKNREIVHNATDIRDYKVKILKKRIEGGNYRIESIKVAEKIISMHLSTFFLKCYQPQ